MADRPKIIAIDLDGTLWYPEVDMLSGPPFKFDAQANAVRDRSGQKMKLIGASQRVLAELATDPAWADCSVAYVSRTEYPEWAVPCLEQFPVTPKLNMLQLAKYREIYPGQKQRHFKAIQKQSNVAFQDMLFFDNERRNCVDCEKLGIVCVYTPDGLTEEAWLGGLAQFAAAASSRR